MALGMVLGAVTMVRLWLAWSLPFGVDEAYAVVVSRSASLSFFDHPPLGFMLARWAADLAGSEHPFVVRLPYQALALFLTWLVYDIARWMAGPRAGLLAVAVFASAPFFLLMSGMVVPDAPLLAAALACVRLLLPLLEEDGRRPAPLAWLGIGLVLAVAGLSKYHAALLMAVAAILVLVSPIGRWHLRAPWAWLGAVVALTGWIPALVLNVEHGWVSLLFQGGRAGSGRGIEAANAARMLLGQVLYLGPLAFGLTIMAVWRAHSPRVPMRQRRLALAGLVPVALFLLLAVVSRGSLPHWTMTGWVLLMPLAGIDAAALAERVWFRRGATGWAVLLVCVAIVVPLHARTGLLTAMLDSRPRWDDTREFSAWDALGPALAARGISLDGHAVAATTWIEASKLGVALGPAVAIGVAGADQRHFGLWARAKAARQAPDYIIRATAAGRGREEAASWIAALAPLYGPLTVEAIAPQQRGRHAILDLVVLRPASARP
jgi:4-amino-4-deoxy-L-arabinose transferase-like glycosyltransferase